MQTGERCVGRKEQEPQSAPRPCAAVQYTCTPALLLSRTNSWWTAEGADRQALQLRSLSKELDSNKALSCITRSGSHPVKVCTSGAARKGKRAGWVYIHVHTKGKPAGGSLMSSQDCEYSSHFFFCSKPLVTSTLVISAKRLTEGRKAAQLTSPCPTPRKVPHHLWLTENRILSLANKQIETLQGNFGWNLWPEAPDSKPDQVHLRFIQPLLLPQGVLGELRLQSLFPSLFPSNSIRFAWIKTWMR